jgi:hypothetical protein
MDVDKVGLPVVLERTLHFYYHIGKFTKATIQHITWYDNHLTRM